MTVVLSLQLSRRPEQRGEYHRGQTDDEADDPPGDVLPHEHRAKSDGDTDDSAGGDQAHEAALDLGAAPISPGDHALGPFVAPRLALVPARLASGRVGIKLGRSPLLRWATFARI